MDVLFGGFSVILVRHIAKFLPLTDKLQLNTIWFNWHNEYSVYRKFEIFELKSLNKERAFQWRYGKSLKN